MFMAFVVMKMMKGGTEDDEKADLGSLRCHYDDVVVASA